MSKAMQPDDYIRANAIGSETELNQVRKAVKGMGCRVNGAWGAWDGRMPAHRYLKLHGDGDLFWASSFPRPKGREWTPRQVFKWQADTSDTPQPGDILSVAQAMRWMADNLDAGRSASDGLEWLSIASLDWESSPLNITEAIDYARLGTLRVALPKQRTVTIDGTEYPVPEPMWEEPGVGQWYWLVEHGAVYGYGWADDVVDDAFWSHHYLYATREEAEQALAIHRAIYGADER